MPHHRGSHAGSPSFYMIMMVGQRRRLRVVRQQRLSRLRGRRGRSAVPVAGRCLRGRGRGRRGESSFGVWPSGCWGSVFSRCSAGSPAVPAPRLVSTTFPFVVCAAAGGAFGGRSLPLPGPCGPRNSSVMRAVQEQLAGGCQRRHRYCVTAQGFVHRCCIPLSPLLFGPPRLGVRRPQRARRLRCLQPQGVGHGAEWLRSRRVPFA